MQVSILKTLMAYFRIEFGKGPCENEFHFLQNDKRVFILMQDGHQDWQLHYNDLSTRRVYNLRTLSEVVDLIFLIAEMEGLYEQATK